MGKDFRFVLGKIAGVAEGMGFETIRASEMSPNRVKKLLEDLGKTRNAFSVPQLSDSLDGVTNQFSVSNRIFGCISISIEIFDWN